MTARNPNWYRAQRIAAGGKQVNLVLTPEDLEQLRKVRSFTGENVHQLVRRLVWAEAQRTEAILASGLINGQDGPDSG